MRKNYFEKPWTKRFIDAFPKFKIDANDPEDTGKVYFWEGWQNSPFYLNTLTEQDLSDIYYHLRAEFYNWHFIFTDDRGISDNVFHIIEDYYPNTKERMQLVEDIRALSLEEFKKSGTFIDSSGSNPKTPTEMNELIDLVDSQTASFQLKSEEQALKTKFNSLYDGVFQEFLDRFKPLFVKLYSGVNDYIYRNIINKEEE